MGLALSAWAAGGVAAVLYGVYRGWVAMEGLRQMSSERVGRARRPGPGPQPQPQAQAPTHSHSPCYVVTLNHGEHHDSTVLKFDKGTRIRFAAGASLLGRKVLFYINYVFGDLEGEKLNAAEFVRSQYVCLPWQHLELCGGGSGDEELVSAGSSPVPDTETFCSVTLRRAGTFHYYFLYDTPVTAEVGDGTVHSEGSGWVSCRPRSLSPLCALTVLTKCLGPLRRWPQALRLAHHASYNMIHFTPVQELGASGSSYSIAEQLKLDKRLASPDLPAPTFQDLEDLLTTIRKEWKMASICDVVLNHTANESSWLRDHPEATYSCVTAPRLRPAALLDAALLRVRTLNHLTSADGLLEEVRDAVWRNVNELRLEELYACDVTAILTEYEARALNRVPAPAWGTPEAEKEKKSDTKEENQLKLIQDPLYRRHKSTVDIELALHLYHRYEVGCVSSAQVVSVGASRLRDHLAALNEAAARELRDHLRCAVDNVLAHVAYERLADDGPKIKELNDKHPLVTPYFLWPADAWRSVSGAEEAALGAGAAHVQAHNGWVMGADPLQDFAQSSNVYLRRELVAWGDSVKLRYGASPADSPWLWAHMRDYVELTAELFDGLRLDNCHSTPVHVAQYMMDCARNVKPDLFVVAELFTDSDLIDNLYVNRLGLDALIREGMSAWSCTELGRLVHRYGGSPCGALHGDVTAQPRAWEHGALGEPARAHVAPAMFLDVTHDNRSPILERSVWDVIPTAACVCAANCAVGSTRGLDELVPHQIHVVDEERPYALWEGAGAVSEGAGVGEGAVSAGAGVVEARRLLNALHQRMADEHYTEVFVDQVDETTVVITRHNPNTRESILIVCSSAFSAPALQDGVPNVRTPTRELTLEGDVTEVLLDLSLQQTHEQQFSRSASYINGLRGYRCVARGAGGAGGVAECDAFRDVTRTESGTRLQWGAVRPGRVVALHVAPRAAARAALSHARALLLQPPDFTDLDLLQLNELLYRSDAEERCASGGSRGVYCVPGAGPLAYAGLRGAASALHDAWRSGDLAHPLLDNLRQGDWLVQYCVSRLAGHAAGARVAAALAPLAALPRFLQPAYVGAALLALCARAECAALHHLAPHAAGGSLRLGLALTSVQLLAVLEDAPLPCVPRAPSLSAGLPHFAAGYMRCWGRDTFVALPGLMLHEGRFQEARWHIVSFASVLRHGLIPNLLDRGVSARYNCRDAVWWWLHAIRRYTQITKSYSLLGESVRRMFPCDSSPPLDGDEAPVQTLADVMQEALDKHFQGQVFRERNAGTQIDAHMTDQGFNVQIGIDPETGFPFGGNEWNCGTWMDKMGSSVAAGTKGRPATPRDGSAIELVALAHAAARWLHTAHAQGHYPHAGLTRLGAGGGAAAWSWAAWAARVEAHFERHYWVPASAGAGDARPDLVHRRAIYKDTHNATHAYTEYQLRPNQAVAMAVSPSLFNTKHALLALDNIEAILMGPLGLKTLDPKDWAYRPNYNNDDHSSDPSTADGFNYHQGPEWAWPLGMFLCARLALGGRAVCARVRAALRAATDELVTSHARGLPELTDAGGARCRYSCTTQAWSNATFIEVLEELEKLERSRTLQSD